MSQPGDEVDQRWMRFGRIALAAVFAAGIAMALSFEYIERGSAIVQVELEGLLIVGLIPAWMLWAGLAAGRLADQWDAPRGIVAAGVLTLIAGHLLLPGSFGWYMDTIEPVSATWAGLWFLYWLLYAAAGTWLIWRGPTWLERLLQKD